MPCTVTPRKALKVLRIELDAVFELLFARLLVICVLLSESAAFCVDSSSEVAITVCPKHCSIEKKTENQEKINRRLNDQRHNSNRKD
jgi:hypothetical protein